MATCQPWDKRCWLNTKCEPADLLCQSMKNEELYSFLVGELCRNPPSCSQKGYLPSELLYEVFKACSQEAAGDSEKFYACLLDFRDLLIESVGKVREVVKK